MSPKYGFALLCCVIAVTIHSQRPAHAQEAPGEAVSLESLLEVPVSAAAKYEQTARHAAASVTVITAEEIHRRGYRTLQEVLAPVRGFYVTDDRQDVYLGVRGFGPPAQLNNRVLILVDGHTLNESTSGSAPIDRRLGLDLSLVERVEVIRGPGSALYGTGAMFAVINVVTKVAPDLPPLSLSVETGSFGHRRAAATVARAFEGGEVVVSGTWGEAAGQDLYFAAFDDSTTNGGVAEGLNWSRHYGFATKASWGRVRFQSNYARVGIGIPTGVGGVIFNDDRAEYAASIGFVELSLTQPFSFDKQLQVRAFGDRTNYDAVYPAYVQLPWETKLQTGLFDYAAHSSTLGSEARFRWDTSPANRFVIGLEYRWAHATQGMESALLPAAEESEDHGRLAAKDYGRFAAYAQNEYSLTPELALVLGLRHDHHSTVGGTLTPRAALIYNPLLSRTFKLLYGEAFRAPGLWELYYSDYGQQANPDLHPERIRTFEAVWDQELRRGVASTVSLFHYRLHDLIVLAPEPASGLAQNQNAGAATASGAELELNARLGPERSGYASYAYARTRDRLTERALVNAPAHLVKAGVRFPLGRRLVAAADTRYESGRLMLSGARTAGSLLVDLTASTRPLWGHLRLKAGVRNLFDAAYQHPASRRHRQQALPQDGRSAFLEARFRL